MGADAKCQALADASDLTSRRTFKAWISDDTSSPAADFVQSNSTYVLANGLAVALRTVKIAEVGQGDAEADKAAPEAQVRKEIKEGVAKYKADRTEKQAVDHEGE